MSTGRFRMMWTILADGVGLFLSYLYGANIPSWIGSWLPKPLAFVRDASLRLYSFPIMLLHLDAVQPVLLHHPGLTWLIIALMFRLGYLLLYLQRRGWSKDLGSPYSGGDYWSAFQFCFNSYYEALKRWNRPIVLKVPKWAYYQRKQTSDPDFFWRGRRLVIEISLLGQPRWHDLKPHLARELMYYNCEDVMIKDILTYYPDRLSWLQIVGLLSGFFILLPVMLVKRWIWPSYWNERVKVADAFAYGLGEGLLLYQHIRGQLQQIEALKQERQKITREIAALENLNQVLQQKAEIKDWSLPGEDERIGYHYASEELFCRRWNQLTVQINALRERESQLAAQEQKMMQAQLILEERREQLIGLLRNEQIWMAQHGIAAPASALSLPSGGV